MILSRQIEDNSTLCIFLPMLYVACTDSVTPSEVENIQRLIDQQDWMDAEDRQLIKNNLDPSKPPTPSEMKLWLSEIQKASANFSIEFKRSLIDIGVDIAVINGMGRNQEFVNKIKTSLRPIEEALGVATSESERFLLASDIKKTDAEDLSTGSTFDKQQMTALLNGDQSEIINKVKAVISDPKFKYHDGDLDSYRERVLDWCKLLADQGFGGMAFPEKYGGGGSISDYFAIMESLSYHDLSMVIKFGVQFGLFGMSVYFLGTEKHHQKYLKAIGDLDLPGSFAMTETGHGSNVRDIETTATYDQSKNTFIIHTPNNLARKDYIGNAACHAQMATVFAKLVIDEIDYGVNAFLVPLRDKSRKLLSGVRIEDCGKKMGLNGVDNGRIWFDQVEIPKDNMLDRYGSVTDGGVFESPISSDSSRFFTMLGTLVGGRIGIPKSGLSAAKSGLAIAIKYGNKRRQFGPENGQEVAILNYKTHQRRLMPLLANAYALHFSLQYLTKRFLNRKEEDMREIESLAAGLKAYATWNTTDTLQTCRETCGGKGFLHENRIGALKNDTEIYTTFEGDNTVLMQLVAKGRLTEFKQEFHDINFFGIINYISDQAKTVITEMNPLVVRNTEESHLLDSEFYLSAFRYRERSVLASAAKRLKSHLDSGMDSFDAFNQCQYHMLIVGVAYTERVVLEQFVAQINATEDESLKGALKTLCDLYSLSTIEKHKGWYLESGYMEGVKTKAIRRVINKLCLDIRKEAVTLVDAFDIPDSCLAAPIAFNDFK